MKKVCSRWGLALCMAIGIFAAGAGAASAVTITYHYTGMFVYEDDSKIVGEIDYTTSANNLFQRVNNDPYGDRMYVKAPVRDRASGNGRSVYPQVDWAKNVTFCYLSGLGVGVGTGSANVSCSSGWNGYGSTRGDDMADSSWWFYGFNKPYHINSNSIRAALKICEDISWQTDPCSWKRYGGISYK